MAAKTSELSDPGSVKNSTRRFTRYVAFAQSTGWRQQVKNREFSSFWQTWKLFAYAKKKVKSLFI